MGRLWRRIESNLENSDLEQLFLSENARECPKMSENQDSDIFGHSQTSSSFLSPRRDFRSNSDISHAHYRQEGEEYTAIDETINELTTALEDAYV